MNAPIVLHAEPAATEARAEISPAASVRSMLPGLVVEDAQGLAFATELLTGVKGEFKRLDAKRLAYGAGARAWLEDLNAYFKPALDAWKASEAVLKEKIASYHARVEDARVAAMIVHAPAPAPAELAGTGVSIRMRKAWRIVDENAVPRDLCSPDRLKIQAAVAAGAQVPGVEIYDEPIVSARAR